MKVLLLHNAGASDLPSGETMVVQTEAAALREQGIEVHTYISQPRGRGWVDSLRRVNVFSSRASYRLVGDLIASFHPHLVHVHGILPDLTTSVFQACRNRSIPTIQTLHNYRWLCVEGGLFRNQQFCDECLTGVRWAGVRHRCTRGSLPASVLLTINNRRQVASGRLFSLVDRFLAVSHFVREQHLRGGFPKNKLTVKYNGIGIPPTIATPTGAQGAGYVAFVGRLDVAKGTSILGQLPEKLGGCELRIAGVGPEEARLRAHLGQRNDVKFLGRIRPAEVTRLLQQATCTVLPSLVPESFGLVAAESLACGTPVVTSRRGGLQELTDRSGGGITVVPDEGAGGFAAAIQRIIGDQRLRQEYAAAGRSFAKDNLSLSKTTEDLVAIYENVLSHR